MLKNSDKIPCEFSYSEASSFLHVSKRSVIDFCVDKSQEYICEKNKDVCQVYIRFYNAFLKKRRYTRSYQKVRRLMQSNKYFLSYAYRFCREYKTTNVLSVVKIYTR